MYKIMENSKKPIISVIVISYNRKTQLEECISSLLNQTYKNFEIILVDSNSTDSTNEYLEQLKNEKRVKVLKNPARSLSLKQNFGISKATGEIIAITDDDCVVDPEWLSNIAKEISFGSPLITGRILPKNRGFKASIRLSERKKIFSNTLINRSTAWRCGCGNNMAFYKKLFYDAGKFDERLGTGTESGAGGDTDFFIRIFRLKKNIVYIPDCVVYHALPLNIDEFLYKKRIYYKSLAYIGLSKYSKTPEGWIMIITRFIHSFLFLLLGLITLKKEKVFQRFYELAGSFDGIKLFLQEKNGDN